jgi:heme A synthase
LNTIKGIALAAAVAVYALIVIGGFVTSTESGLACPDWPLCNGQVIPPLSGPVLIEYAHRVWSLVTFVLVAATAILAWRRIGMQSRITFLSLTTLAAILTQVILGMLTVQSLSHPYVVTTHLALGTLVFGLSLATAVVAMTTTSLERHGVTVG